MAKRIRKQVLDIEPRTALWELAILAGFASWPIVTDGNGRPVHPGAHDTPAQQALRILLARHALEPLSAVDAYMEAVEVVEAYGAADDVEAFRAGRECGAGAWPTIDRRSREERVRAV